MSELAAKSGWEWHELQEAQAKFLRLKALEGSSKVLEEYEQLVQEEIAAKDEQIEKLKERLETEIANKSAPVQGYLELIPPGLAQRIGPELYNGEFSDRLRLFIGESLKTSQTAIDPRTFEFAKKFLTATSFSGKADQLASQIKVASKDGKQMPKRLGQILTGIGYARSQEGKHLKFTPPKELFGLPTETLPSTPSDSQRGGKNRGNEVSNSFNLKKLQ
ncbi:hypothetical protein RA25_20610 [Leisingera sp. ANG-S5]|nr:hypothetical protein RA25_20610 [Leisingera sp. ANG-S5]